MVKDPKGVESIPESNLSDVSQSMLKVLIIKNNDNNNNNNNNNKVN